jgi:hypothetical protein
MRFPWALTLLALVFASLQSIEAGAESSPRVHVEQNVRQSRKAREASRFHELVQREEELQQATVPLPLHRHSRNHFLGPHRVPNNFIVAGEGPQPAVLFDKTNVGLKQSIRTKAARLRLNNELAVWEKIERIQQLIRQRVKHSGNELSLEKNPNLYNRYNAKLKDSGRVAQLSQYWSLGKAVCREISFLTQVALEDAGFEARLAGGSIYRGGQKIGEHVWNEVKLQGQWRIVDTTNPQFNNTLLEVATHAGTANGWIWDRLSDYPFIYRASKL